MQASKPSQPTESQPDSPKRRFSGGMNRGTHRRPLEISALAQLLTPKIVFQPGEPCRVEGWGGKSLMAPRFQSPLIEPDGRISRIRLSDKM